MSIRAVMRVSLISFACVVAGAVVGVVASLYHAAWFPWGLLVTMAGFAAGLTGLRLLFSSRYPALLASLSLMVAVATLAGQDSQGSILVAASLPGLALLVTAGAIASVLLSYPLPRPVRRKDKAVPQR